MPVGRAAEERRDRDSGDLADDVPQRDLDRPVATGVEVDRLEDADVAGDRQRIAADEQVLEGLEAVHRVARSDADDALVGLDPDDRRRERAPRDRVPGGRERRVERQDETVEADGGDTHAGVSRSRCVAGSLTVRKGRQYRSETPPTSDRRHTWPGGGRVRETMQTMRASPPGRARRRSTDRWTIPSWTRFAGRPPRCNSTSSNRSSTAGSAAASSSSAATIVGLSMALDHRDHRRLRRRRDLPVSAAGPRPRRVRSGPAASPKTGGSDPGRRPASGLGRPGRDAGPRRLRHHRPVVRVPVPPRTRSAIRADSPRAWPTEWTPNADGTVWTFKLRDNASSGSTTARRSPSADVVATMERLVAAGNSGLKGVLDAGRRGRDRRRRP